MVESCEELLTGGRANAGRVVRIGNQVARPSHPQTPLVDRFLRHLRSGGIEFVPEPLGSDDEGRQRLGWIEGLAPTAPEPTWVFEDQLLVQVVQAQRRLHRAAAGFDAPLDAPWASNAGDYFPPGAAGALVCHNDLCIANVIVDPETTSFVGIIDFDYVRPVTRLFDIAVLARHWAPFDGANDARSDLDPISRFATIAEIHELTDPQRIEVLDLATEFLDQARRNVRALADAGGVGFQALIEAGYEAQNRSTVDWLVANRGRLTSS